MDASSLLAELALLPPVVVWGILWFGALVEYIFPPFPGDTVVVSGAALVGALGWSVAPVLVAVTLGAVMGAGLDWRVGRALAEAGRIEALPIRLRRAILELVARFEEHGFAILALNRFVPGIRAAFFVAAGYAGLRLIPVLSWATASAVVWNGLLVALGVYLGRNVEGLVSLVARYNAWAGGVVVVMILVASTWAWRRAGSLEPS